MAIKISAKTQAKLTSKHGVKIGEVTECFANRGREDRFLKDTREDHQTDPPTLWFIAETDYGRLLKVVFVARDGDIFVKTAYAPNEVERSIYERHGKLGG